MMNLEKRDKLIFEANILTKELNIMRADSYLWDPEDFQKENEIVARLLEIKKELKIKC